MRLGAKVLVAVYAGLILSAVIGVSVIGFGYGYNSIKNSKYIKYNCTVVHTEVTYQYYQRGYRCYYGAITFRLDNKGENLNVILTVDPHYILCAGNKETADYVSQYYNINSTHTCYLGPNNMVILTLIDTTASLITGIIFIIIFLTLLFCFILSCFL